MAAEWERLAKVDERRAQCIGEAAQGRLIVGHDGRRQPHRGNHDHRVHDIGRLGPSTRHASRPRGALPGRCHVATGEYPA